jgi:hypothetical protein
MLILPYQLASVSTKDVLKIYLPCVSVADRKQRPEYEALKKKYESFKIINSLDEHFDQAVGILDR